MTKTTLMLLVACFGLAACGKAATDDKKAEAPPPLYDNPPFGAGDIDATVDETRKRLAPPAAAPRNDPTDNVQDAQPVGNDGAG